jgi:hypothetical protein
MEYKINHVTRDGSTTKAFLTFYTGAISTENEVPAAPPPVPDDVTESVTRYRRTATVSTGTLEKDGTLTHEQMVPFLNTELATRASALGHTPIDEQTNE